MSSPELVANRLEELLAGAFPETEGEARLQGLARDLQSASLAAPVSLRARVEAIKPIQRSRMPRRHRVAVLVACALLIGAAVGARAYFSGSGPGVVQGEGMPVHDASQ